MKKCIVIGMVIVLIGVVSTPCIGIDICNYKDSLHRLHTKTISSVIDWWPMFHHDPAHIGVSTSDAPETNHLLWTFQTGGYIYSSPAVVNYKVYFGSEDCNVYCLDALTGAEIWNYTTGDWVQSSPAVSDGKVYVGSGDGNIYCLDALTGDEIWTVTTGDWIFPSPTVVDGYVYIGSDNDKMYCLDADTGDEIWTFTAWSISSSPAVVDGKVFFGSNDATVYCLDAEDGDVIWTHKSTQNYWIETSPTVADDKVYVSVKLNTMSCLDIEDGSIIWQNESDNEMFSTPAVANGYVYYGGGWNKFRCLDMDDGSKIWQNEPGFVFSSPAIADGKVYVGSWDKHVYCYDALNGSTIWSYKTNDSVISSPAVAIGKVFIGSNDGKMYCFEDEHCNRNPDAPIIDGPSYGEPNIAYNFTFLSSDPDYDKVFYYIDWGDGTIEDWIGPYYPEEMIMLNHSWDTIDIYEVKAKAKDTNGAESNWSDPFNIRIGDMPPSAPEIDGPSNGFPDEVYSYVFNASDPDGDDVYYWIEWFEGDPSAKWEGPFPSGKAVIFNHSWSKRDTYIITAKAKDVFDFEGPEGTLEVTIPKNKPFNINFPLISWLLERFPILQKILDVLKVNIGS